MDRDLRHRGRRKRRRDSLYSSRGIIQVRVDISLRPSVVEEKRHFGDFEIDTMICRNHKEIARGLDAKFYFARPYHSLVRGANENTNGLIRQYIPKGTNFSELTDEMLAEIEWKLNHRHRNSLGYRTSLE